MPLPKPTWHPWIPSSHFAPGGLADGLVGAWFALEGAGTLLHDLSKRGVDFVGQGTPAWAASKYGPAIDLEASESDYFTADSRLYDGGNDPYYWVCIVSPESISGNEAVIGKWKGGGLDYFLKIDNNLPIFELFVRTTDATNVNVQATSFSNLSVGNWYTLAAGYNAATDNIEISVNGGAIDTASVGGATLNGTETAVALGAQSEDGGNYWDGLMATALRYNRALPAASIRKLHADPYALLRPVRRWWAALDVTAEPPAFVPQTYTADVLVNISPTVSVDANPSPSTDLESNPSPTVEVESG